MFTAVLFIIAKRWKQLKCLSPNEWVNKMWDIHAIEYSSAIKRNELLIHSVYNIDQPQKQYAKCKKPDTKGHIWMIPFIWKIQTDKSHRNRTHNLDIALAGYLVSRFNLLCSAEAAGVLWCSGKNSWIRREKTKMPRTGSREDKEWLLNVYRMFFWNDGNVLKLDKGDCTTLKVF